MSLFNYFEFQRNFEQDYAQFNWTVKEQGLVLSGFSVGYVLTQILGGYLDAWFGGKWVGVTFADIKIQACNRRM